VNGEWSFALLGGLSALAVYILFTLLLATLAVQFLRLSAFIGG